MAKKEYRWNIFLLRATPATPIGSVEAPDAFRSPPCFDRG